MNLIIIGFENFRKSMTYRIIADTLGIGGVTECAYYPGTGVCPGHGGLLMHGS